MKDMIDRQAAIEAIDKIFPADPMRNDYTQGITCGAALATEYIKQLPSAQPEPCNDAVSRQYILGALAEYIDEYGEVDAEGNHDPKWCAMKEAEMVVKEAPSVEPEHDENELNFMQPHKRIPVQLVVSSDCISREDAIECLERLSACDEPFVEIGTDDETFIGRYEAITEISHLPPAQPYTEAEIQKMQDLYQAEIDKAFELGQEDARSEIIHCGECKYYDDSDGCFFSTATTGADGFCHWAERKEGEADG